MQGCHQDWGQGVSPPPMAREAEVWPGTRRSLFVVLAYVRLRAVLVRVCKRCLDATPPAFEEATCASAVADIRCCAARELVGAEIAACLAHRAGFCAEEFGSEPAAEKRREPEKPLPHAIAARRCHGGRWHSTTLRPGSYHECPPWHAHHVSEPVTPADLSNLLCRWCTTGRLAEFGSTLTLYLPISLQTRRCVRVYLRGVGPRWLEPVGTEHTLGANYWDWCWLPSCGVGCRPSRENENNQKKCYFSRTLHC